MTWCPYFVILQRRINVYGALDTQYGEDVRSWSYLNLHIQNILSMPSVDGFPTAIIAQGLEFNNQESNELFTDGDMLWPVKKMRETSMLARMRVVIPELYHVCCIELMKNEVHVCYARQKVSYWDKYSRFLDSNTDTYSLGLVHSINKQLLHGSRKSRCII